VAPPVDPDQVLALAHRAALDAGALLRRRFRGPASGVQSKSTRTDLVSDADREAEALLVGMIRAARPEDEIVAEEGVGVAGASGLRWLVDPLDGTINYLWGVPHWSVSLACLDAEGPLVGVVHDPNRDETFTAVRGGGARLGGGPLALEGAPALEDALVATGFHYDAGARARQAVRLARMLPLVRDVRRFGSAALDLAWVAAGRYDAFVETSLAPWDWAAGGLLVTEAGGAVREIETGDGPDPGLVAGRPALMEPLTALVLG